MGEWWCISLIHLFTFPLKRGQGEQAFSSPGGLIRCQRAKAQKAKDGRTQIGSMRLSAHVQKAFLDELWVHAVNMRSPL